jgi:hypothetical protein
MHITQLAFSVHRAIDARGGRERRRDLIKMRADRAGPVHTFNELDNTNTPRSCKQAVNAAECNAIKYCRRARVVSARVCIAIPMDAARLICLRSYSTQ